VERPEVLTKVAAGSSFPCGRTSGRCPYNNTRSAAPSRSLAEGRANINGAAMADELVTIFLRRVGGKIEAVEMSPRDAELATARLPFSWSRSPDPKSFAPWPYPAELARGTPIVRPR
jgi:hypothetical protein